MRTQQALLSAISAIAFLAVTGPAEAMKVTPFKIRFDPDGYLSSQLFVVENDSDQRIAVELSAQTRDVDNLGHESNADATTDFSIYPSQAIVEPHSTRSVRVQYIGKGPLTEEKAYRLTVEELPVNLDPNARDGNAVRFLLQYRCALYVTPPGSRSDIRMASHEVTPTGVDFTLTNTGTAHSLIKNFTLVLTDATGKVVEINDPGALKGVNSEVLMPKAERHFSITLPPNAGTAIKDVDFRFAEAF